MKSKDSFNLLKNINQKGGTVAGIIMITMIICLIGLIGYFLYRKNSNATYTKIKEGTGKCFNGTEEIITSEHNCSISHNKICRKSIKWTKNPVMWCNKVECYRLGNPSTECNSTTPVWNQLNILK